MNNKEGKLCPLINQVCLLEQCALFSQKLGECEISVMNYNLWQLKNHIQAQVDMTQDVPEATPAVANPPIPPGNAFPRPVLNQMTANAKTSPSTQCAPSQIKRSVP